MEEEKVILTRKGHKKLVEKLNYLKSKKRYEIAEQLEHARALGDLRENAEYDAAKEAKRQLESRIAELEFKLSRAQIVDLKNLPKDKAYIGATIEMKNIDSAEIVRYTLVPQDEADFEQGKISVTSPLGKGLLGKSLREIAEIEVPAGKLKFKILKIMRS